MSEMPVEVLGLFRAFLSQIQPYSLVSQSITGVGQNAGGKMVITSCNFSNDELRRMVEADGCALSRGCCHKCLRLIEREKGARERERERERARSRERGRKRAGVCAFL